MTSKVNWRLKALEDIENYADYIEDKSAEASERFIKSVNQTATLLSSQPLMGSSLKYSRDVSIDVRFFPVKNFHRYIVLYFPLEKGVDIFRVLHTSSDIEILFTKDKRI